MMSVGDQEQEPHGPEPGSSAVEKAKLGPGRDRTALCDVRCVTLSKDAKNTKVQLLWGLLAHAHGEDALKARGTH